MHKSSLIQQRSARWHAAGFSLVEVCLALAVITFSLLPVFGLLAVGMSSFSNSSTRDRAAQIITQISNCLQLASVGPQSASTQYTALAPFDSTTGTNPITWQVSGNPSTYGPLYFDQDGNLTTMATGNARLVAYVAIQPAVASTDPQKPIVPVATVSVAWPATANANWNADVPQFSNAQGYEESTIPLSPISQ